MAPKALLSDIIIDLELPSLHIPSLLEHLQIQMKLKTHNFIRPLLFFILLRSWGNSFRASDVIIDFRSQKGAHNRGWDAQSPMPIVRPVLICKSMGICLIFVNIEVQSKLFSQICLEIAVLWIPCRLGCYLQLHKLDPLIWIVVEISSKNHYGQWGSAHCGWFTHENYK